MNFVNIFNTLILFCVQYIKNIASQIDNSKPG